MNRSKRIKKEMQYVAKEVAVKYIDDKPYVIKIGKKQHVPGYGID